MYRSFKSSKANNDRWIDSDAAATVRLARSIAVVSMCAFLITLMVGVPWSEVRPVVVAASECDAPAPEWLMCEDFEGGVKGWRAWFAESAFTECNGCLDGNEENPNRIRLEHDPGLAASGEWSLHMPAAEEAGFMGGSLTYRTCEGEKRAGCRLQGHEQLHFRTRVRLAEDHEYVHHFLAVAGTRPDEYWAADGNAGCRPNGLSYSDTTLDFNAERELFFYTYFPGMRCDRGGYCSGELARSICEGCTRKAMPCDDGPECCWGNHFSPPEPVILDRGRWVCLELMIRLNTPGEADGVMAFWVDGTLALEQRGMHWRDIPDVQLNKAWLMHYIAGGDADRSNRVWFDDMVVSTEFIGCAGAVEVPTSVPTSASTIVPSPPMPTAEATPAAYLPAYLPWMER